jgi:hypothetical protein
VVEDKDEVATAIRQGITIFREARPISKFTINQGTLQIKTTTKTSTKTISEISKITKGTTTAINEISPNKTIRIIITWVDKEITISPKATKTTIGHENLVKTTTETTKIIMVSIPTTTITMTLFNKNISRNHNLIETIDHLIISTEIITKMLYKLPME